MAYGWAQYVCCLRVDSHILHVYKIVMTTRLTLKCEVLINHWKLHTKFKACYVCAVYYINTLLMCGGYLIRLIHVHQCDHRIPQSQLILVVPSDKRRTVWMENRTAQIVTWFVLINLNNTIVHEKYSYIHIYIVYIHVTAVSEIMVGHQTISNHCPSNYEYVLTFCQGIIYHVIRIHC